MFADLHPITASTCALGARSPRSRPPTGARPACGSPTARTSPADAVLVGDRRRTQHRTGRGGRPGRRQRRAGRRRRCARSDPDIFAVGDIANADHPLLGPGSASSTGPTRSTSPPSRPRPCSATTRAYDELPYFFTDQYDLGMEYVGHAPPGSYAQVVVRGDLASPGVRRFLARRGIPGAGRDERQRVGRDGPHQSAHPIGATP